MAVASWCWASCGSCESNEPRLLSPKRNTDQERAARRVELGQKLYAAGEIGQALEQFEAARRLKPDARSGLYRARCLRRLERWVDAYRAYDRAQSDAKKEKDGEQFAHAAANEQALLTPHLGFVAVEVEDVPKHARLLVNDETVPPSQWDRVVVEPGPVTVELKVPFLPNVERALSLEGGTKVHLKLEAPAPPLADTSTALALARDFGSGYRFERPRRLPPIPGHVYDAALLGAVGFGAYGVLDAMSEDTLAGLEDDCVDGRCPNGKSERQQASAKQQMMAKLGLALGIVGMGSAVTLWVLDDDAETKTTLRLTPSGLFIRGKL